MPQRVPTVQVEDVPVTLGENQALLDVREPDEWQAGHAPGAVHIPLGELAERLDEVPDAELYVICRMGGRSARATMFLNANGWDAVNVDGGMLSWDAAHRPVVADEAGQPPRVL